ncbi:putative ubiquitin C-terminal hydrolase Ubp8 [Aspergillus saccharolyticus JOP 1030-1]|uniref:Ubiquitin carboxyl-terminal hydrolase n=1 Tax=Aspergillus saccharolyticus JOP 1030-1 TaxID=1450539 RepID=A0A318ZJ14_9EURO|nr:ubiquitin carboxyl-terminal hydrolase [Aspergillus saccharolyticus JOP 1030-1]PYH46855.1 ubiquitin carboxyl-terminal hydrolase [Aspergillus saccharolyticus JOP 1030-1]
MATVATVASVVSVSLLSEAEFGCEHLATQLGQDASTADQFKSSFIKAHNSLAVLPKPMDGLAKQNGRLKVNGFLKPKYICLTCSEMCLMGDRQAHTNKTGHSFFMDSRARNLYCQGCGDFVFDHGLERLRCSAAESALQVAKKRRFSDSSADELYIRSNATKRPCAKQGVRGLFNLGQTCYLNVILQTLLHDPILSTYFLGDGHQPHDCTIPDCVGCAVAEAFADFNSIDKAEGFTALNLLVASWRSSPTLAGYQQQDAHEYYQFLVDKLHASTEGHHENHQKGCPCFFHKTFYGKLRSSVTCDKCGNVTRTEDPMVDLSLDVQVKKRAMGGGVGSSTPTLSGCLESFTSPEKLMAGVYNCSQCNGNSQKATKQLRIKKLPAILCMQLKRFEHSASVSEKLEGRIEFPLSINMLPYTTNPNSKVDKARFMYDLSSAVVHKGKLDSGHYYVYCRQGDEWMLFNDDQVTPVTEADVLNADAYLLFYNLRSLASAPPQ